LEGEYGREQRLTEDIQDRARHQRVQLNETEACIHQLKFKKLEIEGQTQLEQNEATRLRRVREAQDEERRQVEAEVNALNTVCEQRMRANDNLTRELHQMAEDDELIRARLDR
jgi:hypothetical protein